MFRFLNIILVSVLFLSCNRATIDLEGFEPSEGGIELIGKWRLDKIEGGSIEMVDEDVSDEEGIFIQFFSNGKVDRIFVYLDEDEGLVTDKTTDTYTVSADGRTVITVNEDEGTSILKIIDLTSTSLVFEEEIDGEISTSYYTKIK